MAEAKYNTTEHKRLRKTYGQWIAAGEGWCTEPICIIERDGGTRWIPPGAPWHVPHNEDGITYRPGPAHARCNVTEGNNRRKTGAQPKRLAL